MKSGTTYACTVLDEHPEICVAKPYLKEPKFFLKDDEFAKGLEYYESNYFAPEKTAWIFGEKTVHYCEHDKAAKRIKESYPDCKIIMMLRNPVHRALSNYFFSKHNGLETRSLEEVFLEDVPAPDYDKKKLLISPFAYLERGEYIRYIQLYERYFDKKNFKIVVMEDFVGSKERIAELYEFLGVSVHFVPASIDEVVHTNDVDLSMVNPEVVDRISDYFVGYKVSLEKHLGIKLNAWDLL